METTRPRSLWVDLVVFLYLFGTGTVLLFSVGWAMAPFENSDPDTAHDAALVGLAVTSFTTAALMARAVWRGNHSRALLPLLVSVLSLSIWALPLLPG